MLWDYLPLPDQACVAALFLEFGLGGVERLADAIVAALEQARGVE